MKWQDLQQNTPRLVVEFSRGPTGGEQFGWGIVGQPPPLSCIGAIARVAAELPFKAGEDCPQSALVVAWDDKWQATWWKHPDIPVDPLMGMLEIIKAILIQSHMAQQKMKQNGGLLGPDGNPLRR